MPIDRLLFLGGIDSDTAPENVPANRLTEAYNLVLERGAVDVAYGNTPVGDAAWLPETGTVREVGGVTDAATGVRYYLLWHSEGQHMIARLTLATGAYDLLVQWPGLKIPAEPTGNVSFLDGLLIYLDAIGELRAVPTAAAERATATAAMLLDPYALHLVHQPPHTAPAAVRETVAATGPLVPRNEVAGSAWQFAFQYEYPSGERTPLGPYSDVLPVARTLDESDTPDERNAIRVAYPAGLLAASALVKTVRLLVREQGELVWQVAGEFTANTDFVFTGTTTGEAIAAADAVKLSEALPVRVGTFTVARSRIFPGDCTEGYAPSLSAQGLVATVGPDVAASEPQAVTIWQVDTDYKNVYYEQDGTERYIRETRTRYYRQATGTYPAPDSTYYELALAGGLYYPGSNNAVLTYQQAFVDFALDEQELASRIITELSGTLGNPPAQYATYVTLRQSSAYPVGLAFYDAHGRTAGAEAVRNVLVPRIDYAAPTPQAIQWQLNSAALIPAWAVSYSLLLGQNRSVSFFLQFQAADLKQFRGDKADGSPDLLPITENGTAFVKEVWVSLTALTTSGRGYTLGKGDRLRFPALTAAKTDFPILSQRGDYVAISKDALPLFFGGEANPRPVVELYSPRESVEAPVLYERGPRYAIVNAGTATADFSVKNGTLAGDTYLGQIADGLPLLEYMNPSRTDYSLWLDAARGRAIPIVRNGTSTRRETLVRWSGVKVQGTKLYGLSVWDDANQEDLPQEQGAIQALALASQSQEEGTILLAVQQAGSASLHLGQVPLSAAAGGQVLALSSKVVGAVNPLRGGYGTRHPASVVAWQGRVYWWDEANAELVRYDNNGAQPLAATYAARNLCRNQATRSVVRLHGAYDAGTESFLLFFEREFRIGRLPPIRNVSALVFSEKGPCFMGVHELPADRAASIGDVFVATKSGQPYRFAANLPRLTWFGVLHVARATAVANELSEATKAWQSIRISSPAKWTVTVANELGQKSRILPQWMKLDKGIWHAAFRRDEASPGFRTEQEALHYGRELQSPTLALTLSYSGTAPARLVSADLNFLVNAGQAPPA